jgi:Sec7-like guanine-nucleotide exchange factor
MKTFTYRRENFEIFEESRKKEESNNKERSVIQSIDFDLSKTDENSNIETDIVTNDEFNQLENIQFLFKSMRYSKKILLEASQKFTVKPEHGLKYLQSLHVLCSPLTPESVATFLRFAPDLPKQITGSYLGELGKDNPNYEADGKDFHKNVLLKYVESFELSGLTVLTFGI